MRLVSIASGSSGNCIYVGSDHSHILVDEMKHAADLSVSLEVEANVGDSWFDAK